MDVLEVDAATPMKAGFQGRSQAEQLRAPVTALVGVTDGAASVLRAVGIDSVFELATAPLFGAALELTEPDAIAAGHQAAGLFPDGVLDADPGTTDPSSLPVDALAALSARHASEVRKHLGVESIGDLAAWPPFRAARSLAGLASAGRVHRDDPEVPSELVPRMNDHATEKVFYTVYATEPIGHRRGAALDGAVSMAKLALHDPERDVRTGSILRYEQSWTPIALTLGNLLHSLALAPGESTRIAMVDWTRRQGVSTTESVSQLESLANSMEQQRSVNEITRAVARESQQGFSNVNANSSVSNSAYTAYGLQNAGEALSAGLAGALTGAVGVGVAGAAAGAGIGGIAGAFAAGVSAGPAALAGAAIGGGAGAIVGGAGGGAIGFMGAAQFGADLQSGSDAVVDVVTTTSSSGTRDVESEMLQNVTNRTQQHSTNARNRRASIVQEVTQSESERVSTRVVTNYNHMHALTMQYFEVVQVYAVRTQLAERTACLYVPFEPIEKWTPELVRAFRETIMASALTTSVHYSLATTAGTVAINSPTYPSIPAKWLAKRDHDELLDEARRTLDDAVSLDPHNGWRLPENLELTWVFGTDATGSGPFASHDTNFVDGQLIAHLNGGATREFALGELEADPIRLGDLRRLDYRVRVRAGETLDMAAELDDPKNFTLTLIFATPSGDSIRVPVPYQITSAMVDGDELLVTIAVADVAMSMTRLLEHLNDHTAYYSRQILRRRNNPLVSKLLATFRHGDDLLADVVDPDPVGVTGNDLIFRLVDEPLGLPDQTVRTEDIVPVGTGGVFAEAVQGRANSAERLDLTRFWNWQDSPIPIVAPEIAPYTFGSRATAADVRPGSLDPAVLAQQNGADLPTPQGTAAVLTTIQSQLFRDMSGISQSAQLAQTALQEAARGATEAGAQVSNNLRAGMQHTTDVVEKVTEMTGEFGTMLAEEGFGLLGDVATGALGSAGGAQVLGSGGSGRGAIGAGVGARRVVTGSPGSASGPLAHRNPSTAGAVLNEARRNGANSTSTIPFGPGSHTTTNGSGSNGPTSNGSGSNDLADDIIQGLGGVWSNNGPTATHGATWDPPTVTDPAARPDAVTALLPSLADAAASDRAFFDALAATADLMVELERRGEPTAEVLSAALSRLAPAWRTRVDAAVAAVNGGDLDALARVDELVAAAYQFAGLAGGDNPADVAAQIDFDLKFVDLVVPTEVVGGEQIVVSGRLVRVLPDGSEVPAEGNTVTMHGLPMAPAFATTSTGADGSFSVTATHGVPDPTFDGVHRFAGFHDLELHLSAASTRSAMFAAEHFVVIPGALECTIEGAVYNHNNTDAFIGSVVIAPIGMLLRFTFRLTKGGQAVQRHPITKEDIHLTGSGLYGEPTFTDNDGEFVVEYVADDNETSVAYLSAVVRVGQEEAVAAASIQIVEQ